MCPTVTGILYDTNLPLIGHHHPATAPFASEFLHY